MSTISTTASSSIAALLADTVSTSAAAAPSQPSRSKRAAAGDEKATQVELSDAVKTILAKASSDMAAAGGLQAFVESRRGNANANPYSASGGGARKDVNTTFQQLTGGSNGATTDSTDGLAPVEPARSFSSQLQFGGVSVSVSANARDGSFSTEVNGPNGLHMFDKRFGESAGVGGFSGLKPGMTAGESQRGNVEYITFAESDAAAVSASTSS